MKKKTKVTIAVVTALLLVGTGVFIAWQKFYDKPEEQVAESLNEVLMGIAWNDEMIEKAKSYGNFNNEPDEVLELTTERIQEGVDVRLELTKINNNEEEGRELFEFYNSKASNGMFEDAPMIDAAEYNVYKVREFFSEEVEDPYPIMIQVGEDEMDLVIDGQAWFISPFMFATGKDELGYFYLLGTIRPNEAEKTCVQYYPLNDNEANHKICIK